MSYQESLEAAGAEVHSFEHFGDYQGTWLAKVTFNGEQSWVTGSYGSCSGCDAFEREFSYRDDEKPDYQDRLIAFGSEYLLARMDQEEAEREFPTDDTWNKEAGVYVRSHPIETQNS